MAKDNESTNPAADAIRRKLDALYSDEPSAKEEIQKVDSLDPRQRLSKYQRHMQELSDSGRSMAEIQTLWHEYYQGLSDKEKHEVWQEFYDSHKQRRQPDGRTQGSPRVETELNDQEHSKQTTRTRRNYRRHDHQVSARAKQTDVKEELIHRATTHRRTKKVKHNIKALAFGLSMGGTVVLILMFSFFNEQFITPFIRPSYAISTPIITDPSTSGPVGPEPKIIIPKINLEAPVVYDEPSIDEKNVQNALERGVLHYATTPNPGELGNGVIFGHSSSNILNKGKYKFAFLLLKSLDEGDTFIVQKDGKRFVYKVFKKYVTSPKDISVLGTNDKKATMTLVTCDPPGMSTNRLIVVGEQIYPNPDLNTQSTAITNEAKPVELPSNSITLWQRIKNWL